MTDFNEFENPGSVPEKTTGSIISHAFEMYKGSILYVLAAIVIYLIVSMIVSSVAGVNMQEVMEDMQGQTDPTKINFLAIPGMATYYGISGLASILLSPLYVGIIYILNKRNNQNQIDFGDLFIGYRQNFANILVYSVVSGLILGVSAALCVLPVFFVAPLLMLGYPILLFENAGVGTALSKAYNIAKENYGVFLGATLLGALISISGLILCFVGILLTAYFYVAVMYSLYVAYVGKPSIAASH